MIIRPRKQSFPLGLLIICAATVSIILFTVRVFISPNDNSYRDPASIICLVGFCIWGIVFTAISFMEFARLRFSKMATITISNTGIHDNLSIFSVGHISWSEISGIHVISSPKNKVLIIVVDNPDRFIARKSQPLRWFLKSMTKKFGSPVFIQQRKIDYDIFTLREDLASALNAIGK